MILALDPGPVKSSLVQWDGVRLLDVATLDNYRIIDYIISCPAYLLIEQVKSYGMAVGETVFETVFWSGRFAQVAQHGFNRLGRMDVKMHLCGNPRARDGNIIQALKDRFGPKPTKSRPNPVYGEFKPAADQWQAWALGVTYYDLYVDRKK
jgi:hypothetical protein